MLLNAYDSTVGKQYKATDRVESTIKTLHLTRNLVPTTKEGVYVITYETSLDIPILAFPITMTGFNKKIITVYDERPFRNKNNTVVQANEIAIQKLAAFLQQDWAEGNYTPVKGSRLQATKAFAEAISSRLIRRAGLDINEGLTLKILLCHYFVGLEEDIATGLDFITTNVVRSIYGTEKGYISGVIDGVNKMETLSHLLGAITTNPILFKLKTLDLKDFIAVISGIGFSALGGKVIAAACEAPCLFTALVYGAARFKVYNKTPLGMALDPKYNKNTLESFIKLIDYTYDLNG